MTNTYISLFMNNVTFKNVEAPNGQNLRTVYKQAQAIAL